MSFPNENGGGGFGLGSTGSNSTDMDDDDYQDDTGKSASALARDVIIIFLAGVGIIIGLVVLVYLISVIMDRYCCCCSRFDPLMTGASNELDNGPIAHKAGLRGLTLEERRTILDHLLVGTPYVNDMASSQANSTKDIEEGAAIPQEHGGGEPDPPDEVEHSLDIDQKKEDGETEEEATTSSQKKSAENTDGEEEATTPSENDINATVQSAENTDGENMLDDASHNNSCAICLSEYEEGDMVLRGKLCEHMFHHSCTMEWLDKHDHCPYCRSEMVSPAEFRETAIELLGQERVTQLSMWRSEANGDNTDGDPQEDSNIAEQSDVEA